MVMSEPSPVSWWIGSRISQTSRGASWATMPAFLMQLDEGPRRAVADRRLVGVHLDERVVDAHAGEGGDDVLDGVDLDRALGEGGGALDGLDLVDAASMNGWSGRSMRRNLKPWLAGAGLRVSVTFSPVWREVPFEGGGAGEGVLLVARHRGRYRA